MKILFSGGGTGGHFYPIIAVAEAIRKIASEEKLLPPKLYFMAPDPYEPHALFEQEITYIRVPAGRLRRYFSLKNATDLFKTAYGSFKALLAMFSIFPDVVFGKGAYASFPALLAARLLSIPVVIHESDSEPGRVNLWAGKFAKRVALSYPEASKYFPKEKTAVTGNPIRADIRTPVSEGAREFLKLEEFTPTLLVLGGSQGAESINNTLLDALPRLLEKYQIIHQTGEKNQETVSKMAAGILHAHPHKNRYHPFGYLNTLSLRMAAGASSLVISRAGSTLFEIASWGLPAVVVPIPEGISHDQTKNAFAYARSGAAVVIEQHNLTPSVLLLQIENILGDKQKEQSMRQAASSFSRGDAAETIAREIISLALEHERV